MPNTLAHIGVQGITTKSIFKFADLKWIYIGCIIPDFPWIIQRILRASNLFNLYDVRDYSIILATFLFCIILSAALSLYSVYSKRVFFILVFSSFFHLMLDPLQIKWANGTHLFAPFSWHLLSFDLFWPESLPTYIITAFGLFYLIFYYKKAVKESSDLVLPDFKKMVLSFSLLLIYFIVPFFMLNLPEQNNNHFVKTLRNYSTREGKYIELDRASYIPGTAGNFLSTFAGEKIKAVNLNLKEKSLISIKGKFITRDEIYVEDYHIHSSFRDDASMVGISLTAILWLNCIFLSLNRKPNVSYLYQKKM
jgi:hypothetical protein